MVFQRPHTRKGVRILLSEWRERLAKLRHLLTYQYSQLKNQGGEGDPEGVRVNQEVSLSDVAAVTAWLTDGIPRKSWDRNGLGPRVRRNVISVLLFLLVILYSRTLC